MARITSKDIAREAGVSQTTVSFVLNNRPNASISAETRERVLDAAYRMGYRPPARKQLRHTITIGLMVPTLSNLYYPFILQAIEIDAKSRGINVLIMDIQRNAENEGQYLSYLKNGMIDGILSLYIPYSTIPKELPFVIVSECQPGVSVDTLSLNSYKAGYMLAEHLIQLGHKHFAYLSSPFSGITSARKYRLDGAFACLNEVGLSGNLSVFTETEERELDDSAYEYDCGYRLTQRLLEEKNPATAIICVNDTTAAGCMTALHEAGKQIPNDIAVTGFDNLLIGKMMTPPLTSVDQMATHACRVALDRLIERIVHPTQDFLPIKMEYLPHLIERESTTGKRTNSNI